MEEEGGKERERERVVCEGVLGRAEDGRMRRARRMRVRVRVSGMVIIRWGSCIACVPFLLSFVLGGITGR